jgi:hypothetical protein
MTTEKGKLRWGLNFVGGETWYVSCLGENASYANT